MIVDSDVLIEILRGNQKTSTWLSEARRGGERLMYSPVSRAEIRAGNRPEEERAIEDLFAVLELTVIDAATADLAGEQLALNRRSHALELGDALIAASALQHLQALATFNHKHFPGVPHLVRPAR